MSESPAIDAWQPYNVLPPSTKRKLSSLYPPPKRDSTYFETLSISPSVVTERVHGKFLQLETAEGKVSDWRKKELKVREEEKEKKLRRKVREGDCGLIGRRKKRRDAKLAKKEGVEVDKKDERVSYDAIAPLHQLWLGYIAELLGIPILVNPPPTSAATLPPTPTATTSTLLPTFPPKIPDPASRASNDMKINVSTIQTKLLKAELVGSIITVKRAKNPSLVTMSGIVLQETQGTFKIVTPKSRVKIIPKKHSVFALSLPLIPIASLGETSKQLEFDIYGDAFCYRAADRISKKWKAGGGTGGVELM